MPEGEYICYGQFDIGKKALWLGNVTFRGDSYQTNVGATGRYRNVGGRLEWQGTPPLGFAVGVLEQTTPKGLIRLFPRAVGDREKAAICSQKEGGNPGAAPAGGGFAPGARVETQYAGLWYPATVIQCNATQCRVKYDNPDYTDQWVDIGWVRPRK